MQSTPRVPNHPDNVFFLEGKDHSYTCQCGASEYQDAYIDLGRLGKHMMPRIRWCPKCHPDEYGLPKQQKFSASVEKRADQVIGGKGIYIFGGSGTFKTMSAKRISDCIRSKGKHTYVTSMHKIFTDIHDCIGTSKSEGDVYARCVSCDALFIDDIGKEQFSESSIPVVYRVINSRYERHMKPIVFTSNYSLDSLMEKIAYVDEVTAIAIGSRIAEMCELVEVVGDDARIRERVASV